MHTRTIWIGVVILAAAGIAAVLLAGKDGGGGASEQPPPTTPVRRRPPPIRIAGEVLDEAGLPVKGATVYVLDKDRLGADRDKIDHEVTDENGRWALHTRKTVESWIGVVAPGYRTALLDGDGVDITKKIIHVVTRSPALTVTVADAEGRPKPEVGLQLAPWPPGGTYFCPGPLCRQGEQWRVTDAEGRSVFRQDVAAPVTITPFLDGFHSHPATVWLPDAEGEVRIVMHPNASLHLEVTADGEALPTDVLVTLEFLDPETHAVAFAFTQAPSTPGQVRIERAIPPGSYRLRVAVPDRPAVLVGPVAVPDTGERIARTAVTVPASGEATTGRLVLRLEGNQGTRGPRGRRRAPLSFLQRVDGPWAALGWRPGAPEAFDPARQRLEYVLEPGTWRVLVSDVLTGRAAEERALEVRAGETTEHVVAMQPGQFGALPPVQEGTVYVRTLEARAPDGSVLPVFGSSRDGRTRFSRSLDLIGRKLRGEDVVVGPYPLDTFELRLLRSDGTAKTAAYR